MGHLHQFDPARDITFAHSELRGAWPVYKGPMGIDATFKEGYPDPLEMPDEIVEKVSRRCGMSISGSMATRLALLLDSIKFEHSVFALPFAYIGMVLAARGIPALDKVFWITVAMVGARTLAMATNRIADARYDALNPRTARRAIPKGLLSRRDMLLLAAAGLAALVLAPGC